MIFIIGRFCRIHQHLPCGLGEGISGNNVEVFFFTELQKHGIILKK